MAILILCYLTAINQLKCSIFYEKIAKQAGDEERIINYEWPKESRCLKKMIHQITRYRALASLQQVLRVSELVFGLTEKHVSSQSSVIITNGKNIIPSAKLYLGFRKQFCVLKISTFLYEDCRNLSDFFYLLFSRQFSTKR